MSVRNEIKAQIIRAGFTKQEVVDLLHDEYGWSNRSTNIVQRQSGRSRTPVAAPVRTVCGWWRLL